MVQVWVVGEVLIDLIPEGVDSKPVVGGGPANTAKALQSLVLILSLLMGSQLMVMVRWQKMN